MEQIIGILLIYGPFALVILYALYKLFKRRALPNFWMRFFSIVVTIFPFTILALFATAMFIGGIVDERFHQQLMEGGVGKFLAASAFFLAGPAGLVGLLYVLLGHKTRFELGMLIYGFSVYLLLLGGSLVRMIKEDTFVAMYEESIGSDYLSAFIYLGIGAYALFTLWVVMWNIKTVYQEVKKNAAKEKERSL